MASQRPSATDPQALVLSESMGGVLEANDRMSLPGDLLCQILAHLPCTRRKLGLMIVCKAWCAALTRPGVHLQGDPFIFEGQPALSTAVLAVIPSIVLLGTFRSLSWLPSHLLNLECDNSILHLKTRLPCLEHLQTLQLGCESLFTVSSRCANLVKLSLPATRMKVFNRVTRELRSLQHLRAVHVWWGTSGDGEEDQFNLARSKLELSSGCRLKISHRTDNIATLLPPQICLPMLAVIDLREPQDSAVFQHRAQRFIDLTPLHECTTFELLELSCMYPDQVHFSGLDRLPQDADIVVQCWSKDPVPSPAPGWKSRVVWQDSAGQWVRYFICRV